MEERLENRTIMLREMQTLFVLRKDLYVEVPPRLSRTSIGMERPSLIREVMA